MAERNLKKKFPSYFEKFDIPQWAKEQDIEVFRACCTRRVEKESFLNSYEENGFESLDGCKESDPSLYSLSTYMKFKDVKRFLHLTSCYKIPYTIAKGITSSMCGVSLITKEWYKQIGKKNRNSHVDWWLYENAEPWIYFKEVDINEY